MKGVLSSGHCSVVGVLKQVLTQGETDQRGRSLSLQLGSAALAITRVLGDCSIKRGHCSLNLELGFTQLNMLCHVRDFNDLS